MRQITKDIEITAGGAPLTFRLTKLDAFSGVALLRLLLRLESRPAPANEAGEAKPPTLLDLISSLSEEELRSVMTSVLNHTEVLLPAGPHPVMTGPEWSYPDIRHDPPTCMKLLLEGMAWSLSGFFGEGGPVSPPAPAATSP